MNKKPSKYKARLPMEAGVCVCVYVCSWNAPSSLPKEPAFIAWSRDEVTVNMAF